MDKDQIGYVLGDAYHMEASYLFSGKLKKSHTTAGVRRDKDHAQS